MSILATTKVLKSIYIDILGLYILPVAPVSLTGHGFQGFSQGAHVLMPSCPVTNPLPTKVLICSPLGTLVNILGMNWHVKALKRNGELLGKIANETEPKHQVFIVIRAKSGFFFYV
jgi:hypothetical protein